MRFVIALAFVSSVTLGCGGSSSSSGGGAIEPGAVPVAATEEVGGGTAQAGDPCDFGGAEGFTCRGGILCCYPEEGEVDYGTCAESCPGYD